MSPGISAVVLAAGQSRRMGRDKALLEWEGAPLWRRQQALLQKAGATEMFLSARPDQAWAAQAGGFAAVLHDPIAGCGPLAGVVAALVRASHPWVMVLAVDLPAMSADWFVRLASHCASGRGAVGRQGGCFEPLAAIYPRELHGLAAAALARGDYSLQRLLSAAVTAGQVRAQPLTAGDEGLFTNWNEGILAPPKSAP